MHYISRSIPPPPKKKHSFHNPTFIQHKTMKTFLHSVGAKFYCYTFMQTTSKKYVPTTHNHDGKI